MAVVLYRSEVIFIPLHLPQRVVGITQVAQSNALPQHYLKSLSYPIYRSSVP